VRNQPRLFVIGKRAGETSYEYLWFGPLCFAAYLRWWGFGRRPDFGYCFCLYLGPIAIGTRALRKNPPRKTTTGRV
jgi:hypothetical protein